MIFEKKSAEDEKKSAGLRLLGRIMREKTGSVEQHMSEEVGVGELAPQKDNKIFAGRKKKRVKRRKCNNCGGSPIGAAAPPKNQSLF